MSYVEGRLKALGAPRSRVYHRHIGDPIVRVPHFKYPPGATEKPCTRCKIVKPLTDYSELKGGALGRQPRCKSCINAIGKEYTRKHRETKAGRPRPDHCDCCGVPHTLRRAMHWDHNHATNQFRGWLCHHCNTMLGTVKDNVEHLQLLIEYLKRGGGPPRPILR